MDNNNPTGPAGILKTAINAGVTKAKRRAYKQLMLAVLAGAFIAFASEGSNMAAFNLLSDPSTYGMGRLVAGVVFGVGLMLVVIAGGELFSGNVLLSAALFDRKIKPSALMKNWTIVFVGNFIGSILIAAMIICSGQLNSGGGLLGGMTVKIAFNKVSLSFLSAFALGIMCNWLVCLAVWMSYAAKDITGKLLSIFFVIGLFIVSGFEHCIANMYYIPAGIMAKSNALWAEMSGLTAAQLGTLNWGAFLTRNLLPVTLGNIVGGMVFVGGFYWIIYRDES